jgi:hypothetical protein
MHDTAAGKNHRSSFPDPQLEEDTQTVHNTIAIFRRNIVFLG